MINLRESWRSFRHEQPGRRFAQRHERLNRRPRGPLSRVLRTALGVLLVAVGIVFMPLPGPGVVPLLLGAAVLAGESAGMAHWLDRAELRLRGWLRR